jgi:hypothetical protein
LTESHAEDSLHEKKEAVMSAPQGLIKHIRQIDGKARNGRAWSTVVGLLLSGVIAPALLQVDAQQEKSDSGFKVTYTRTGQIATEITISETELTRIVTMCHTPGGGQSCENPTSESRKAQLQAGDVEKLKKEIRGSDFQQLQGLYGTHNFSYPKTITVETEGITKSVVYRAGSGASPAPGAFLLVEKSIEALESKVFPSGQAKLPATAGSDKTKER